VELGPVELNFLTARELIEVKRWVDRRDGQAVGLRNSIDKIRGYHGAATRHVLNEEARVSWNMSAEMLGDEPRVCVISAARRRSGDNGDCFSLIKV
jgi:hypothetical protein